MTSNYSTIARPVAILLAAGLFLCGQTAPCGTCHGAIAATQAQTRMAQTWRGKSVPSTPPSSTRDGIGYAVAAGKWRVGFGKGLTVPIESVLGGPRHGYSLLARVTAINGMRLDRAPLVETRYLLAPGNTLEFSPGHSAEKPRTWETAIGRVLSPGFEARCLTCHAAATNGVQCGQCHAQGPTHALNLAKLSNAERIAQCGTCHADGRELADPMPEDLLIASQADALTRSECYIQSGQAFNCSGCHDPHKDRPAANICLSCHGSGVTCPVNPSGNCVECHMPLQPRDSFRMVDHWIRVVGPSTRKTAGPARRAFLRMILVPTREQAEQIRSELARGGKFADLARRYSKDPSAQNGGFLGAMQLDQMNPPLAKAIAQLGYGDSSPVIDGGRGFYLFERQTRDFRWRADQLFLQGKVREALEINPTFLRALLAVGVDAGKRGDTAGAIAMLETAARLYPKDTGTQLNLGIAYGAAGRTEDEIAAYERALEGEPDLVAARLNLGAAYLAIGRVDAAEKAYREAIEANPLSAAAYNNLSIVLNEQHRPAEARRAAAQANAIGHP